MFGISLYLPGPYCIDTLSVLDVEAGGMDICVVAGVSAVMSPLISMSRSSEWLPHNYL